MNFMLPHRPLAGYRFPPVKQQHHYPCSLPIRDVLEIVGTAVPIDSTVSHSMKGYLVG